MAIQNLIFLFLLFCPTYFRGDFYGPYFIIWNVGQGQWTTFVTEDSCWHFDIGGETNPTFKVQEFCRKKNQKLFLSHWDWDHMSFLENYSKGNQLCYEYRPKGIASFYKISIFNKVPQCVSDEKNVVRVFAGLNGKKSNDTSQVFTTAHILTPGDSTSVEEKIWAYDLKKFRIEGLVLGHHGSQYSTSDLLLKKLPDLKWAVSSARYKKYRHPHVDVVARLHKSKVPLLRTEDWGHLIFETRE